MTIIKQVWRDLGVSEFSILSVIACIITAIFGGYASNTLYALLGGVVIGITPIGY